MEFTGVGFEIAAIWRSSEISSTEFFTDSNGLDLLSREQKQGKDSQDVPASTYAVQTMAGIIDRENNSMTILVDQTHGVTAKPMKG